MLWRLPAPVRSFLAPAHRRFTSTAAAPVPPLRILFCGSDDFSIASLRALSQAQRDVPKLIESIHVVHRPAKPTGRGLKSLRDVPIKPAAAEERCVTHTIDTFTGWTPPSRVDLIIAVSFGLFVPPRILNLAKYGGLNVHPSLLPDLKGPAPIQHALLKCRQHTGVSVQTLHPAQFDGGTILAQTPSPGIPIPDWANAEDLTKQLAHEGANMLVDVLISRAFVPPLKNVGWYKDSGGPVAHAGKILKGDQQVDFSKSTLDDVFAIKRAIGEPWCWLPNGDRLILNEFSEAEVAEQEHGLRRMWLGPSRGSKHDVPLARMACGRTLHIDKSTIGGRPVGGGNQRLVRMLRERQGGSVAIDD
ncbi:methionyl-tRNA formyltransferase [Karstenula rhodostoma CBS 690.94]|uniref:methionyl-tRNA formyltransferase n=1 Tax=Karstenula rhodostoma CBS 690.94 TaxID=1392251 RepID=A0A9P4PCD1_9PLEO|nr:methionyl-tRNA formyltransferase [Karstenula rhodostoma CBS 690.94]